MRIKEIGLLNDSNQTQIVGRVAWEESARPEQLIFFRSETSTAPRTPDANIFLLAAYPIAVAHGEKRISIDQPTSPLLRERLADVHGWWRKWGLAGPDAPIVESPQADNFDDSNASANVGFLSGGVDSLHMLYRNHTRFPAGSHGRIDQAVFIRGYDPELTEAERDRVYGPAVKSVSKLAASTGIGLRQISTNLRALDPALPLWIKQFHGPAMAATAHAAIPGRATVSFAATFDIANMEAWGSHPLIDSSLSTERISFVHWGSPFSRLEKIRDLLNWPEALSGVWVCTAKVADVQNCGNCEKCIRTKLEIVAAGGDVPDVFENKTLTASSLPKITNAYQRSCYRELVEPLRKRGLRTLAAAVDWNVRTAGTPFQLSSLLRLKRNAGRQVRQLLRRGSLHA